MFASKLAATWQARRPRELLVNYPIGDSVIGLGETTWSREDGEGGGDDARALGSHACITPSRNPVVFSVIYETASVWFSGSL